MKDGARMRGYENLRYSCRLSNPNRKKTRILVQVQWNTKRNTRIVDFITKIVTLFEQLWNVNVWQLGRKLFTCKFIIIWHVIFLRYWFTDYITWVLQISFEWLIWEHILVVTWKCSVAPPDRTLIRSNRITTHTVSQRHRKHLNFVFFKFIYTWSWFRFVFLWCNIPQSKEYGEISYKEKQEIISTRFKEWNNQYVWIPETKIITKCTETMVYQSFPEHHTHHWGNPSCAVPARIERDHNHIGSQSPQSELPFGQRIPFQ